jgi:hypothetical protein
MVKSCTIWNDNQCADNYRLGFDFENDKKPDKIVLSNRDDDRGYDNPVRWEFEIVDKKYIDDADANLQRQITENATRIADHETRITNNEHTLADHETRIANNTSNITANQNQIMSVQGAVASLDSQVVNNTNSISNNDSRITALESRPTPHYAYLDRSYISENGPDWAYVHSYISFLSAEHVTITAEIDYQCLNDLMLNIPFESISPFDWDAGTSPTTHGTMTYAYEGKAPDYTHFDKHIVGWVNKIGPAGNEFGTLTTNDINVVASTYSYTIGGSPVMAVPSVQINTMVGSKQTGRFVINFNFDLVVRH